MSTGSAATIVIEILRQEGEQTLESLSYRSGLGWAQVFGEIDRLSRTGTVWLRRSTGSDYYVSLSGAPR